MSLFSLLRNMGKRYAKSLLRNLLEIACKKEPEEILCLLNETKASFISFDIFDTLVERLVNCPEDVFTLLEHDFKKEFGLEKPIAKLRRDAQNKAQELSSLPEITLDEIYARMNLSEPERQWLRNREIELEVAICVPRLDMLPVYQFAISSHKKVFLTSDMYLPFEVVEKILQKCGIRNYERLFLSSVERKVKRDGSLFKAIFKSENIAPKELIHVGDNARSDYLVPKRLGMASILVRRNNRKRTKNAVARDIVRNYISRNDVIYGDDFERIGFRILGPMLYGFSKWLVKYAREGRFDSLLFLMREGALLKEAYETLGGSRDKTKLLYVSRQSTTLPFLDEVKDLAELLRLLQARRLVYTVKDLLLACRIDTESNQGKKLLKRGAENTRAWSKEECDSFFEDLFPLLVQSSQENRKNFLKYLEKNKLGTRNLTIDVGYHGTIQRNIQKILPNLKFDGAYLGYFVCEERSKISATGYFFNEEEDPKLYDIALASGIFELLFLSTEGTTLGYDIKGNPILGEPDNSEKQSARIISAQAAALDFVRSFALLDSILKLDDADWFGFYSDFVRKPTLENLRAIQHLSFRDAHIEPLIPNRTAFYYIFRPRVCLKDFVESPCKVYFLKHLLRINLPYYRFLVWLRRIDKEHKEKRKRNPF